jgi:hypothetical protein
MCNFEVVSEKSYLYGTLVLGIRSSQKSTETFAIIQRRHSEQATEWAIQSSNPGRGNIIISLQLPNLLWGLLLNGYWGVKRPWREVTNLLQTSADFNGRTSAPSIWLNGVDRVKFTFDGDTERSAEMRACCSREVG